MNIQEIDKWLDNEYGTSYTRLEELHDYFFEKYTDQKEEIERLNNIINALEQELIEKIEAVKTIKDMLGEDAYIVNPHIDSLEQEYNYFYKKLQELKGSDKE